MCGVMAVETSGLEASGRQLCAMEGRECAGFHCNQKSTAGDSLMTAAHVQPWHMVVSPGCPENGSSAGHYIR